MANSECRWQCPQEWSEWSEWLAAGLHARSRWRLPVLLMGMLFAGGRRTVTTWLRAAGVSDDFQDYYYFLAALGRKTNSVSTALMLLVLRGAAGDEDRRRYNALVLLGQGAPETTDSSECPATSCGKLVHRPYCPIQPTASSDVSLVTPITFAFAAPAWLGGGRTTIFTAALGRRTPVPYSEVLTGP